MEDFLDVKEKKLKGEIIKSNGSRNKMAMVSPKEFWKRKKKKRKTSILTNGHGAANYAASPGRTMVEQGRQEEDSKDTDRNHSSPGARTDVR